MNIRFLGTGTSTGVPHIGCDCAVCKSDDVRDCRLRASLLVTEQERKILIDCGPDFRQQALAADIRHLDAVLITHEHYDHMWGMDDLRTLGDSHIYAEDRVLTVLQGNMPYCFGENKYPGSPTLHLHTLLPFHTYDIAGIHVTPLRVMHASLPILGYRLNNVAYITDMKTMSEEVLEYLEELDVLVINALRHTQHPSHICLEEACEWANRIGAKRTYFTHCSHDMGLHAQVEKTLPKGMFLAYDGLVL